MIRNIVVGYDDSRCAQIAVEQAVEIADATSGRIHLVLIAEQPASVADLGFGGGGSSESAPPPIAEYDSPEERLAQDELDFSPDIEMSAAGRLLEDTGVAYTVSRLYGNPADRLVRRGWLADLLVIGRGTVAYKGESGKLGAVSRQILMRTATPTLLCDVDYVPINSALLLYEPTEVGGRALACAGEFCASLNIALNVVVTGPDRRAAGRVLREARFALRSYHVDATFDIFPGAAADAVQSQAAQHKSGLVIMPQPPKPLWSWQTPSALRSATSLPGALVLIVP